MRVGVSVPRVHPPPEWGCKSIGITSKLPESVSLNTAGKWCEIVLNCYRL